MTTVAADRTEVTADGIAVTSDNTEVTADGTAATTDNTEVTADSRGHLRTHIVRFATVGATTTVLHLGLFALLGLAVSSQVANLLALVLATVVNTYLNRVWTFGQGAGNVAREQAQGMLVFLLTWVATGVGLAALEVVWPDAGTLVQVLAVGACTAVSTIVRFLAMRYWIFAQDTVR